MWYEMSWDELWKGFAMLMMTDILLTLWGSLL